ncbi:MAG: cysteine desulfurase [Lentimicrobium sp.]|jgi:cysteine desulfurase/selenocysteine lyase|nr:cysteine desulfurase [Lentimicrobium sp.]
MNKKPEIVLPAFDLEKIRQEFPILSRKVHNKPLVYFDNAATTQKPQPVIDALVSYYSELNSNVHRGVHLLSQQATTAFEEAREKVRAYVNAKYSREVIFTRGCTEAINMVASSWGRKNVGAGDEILITALEHHSNIVPWQMLCEEKGAELRVCPILEDGSIDLNVLDGLMTPKTRLLAITHISNTLGTINPVKEITRMAHQKGIVVLIDGAQSMSHMKVDVQDIDCDFYTFSAHKVYGPMGIGGLYGKESILNDMPPYQGGGEMIQSVTFAKTIYNELPFKFEAGTPNVGDAIAFGVALDYMNTIGIEAIAAWEHELLRYATERFQADPLIRIIGRAPEKASLVSFMIGDIHPYDAGTIIDQFGIAVRTGTHCAQPLIDQLGLPGTIRASFAFYNTKEEIDRLMEAIVKVEDMFL